MRIKIQKQQLLIVFVCMALLSIECKVDKVAEDATDNIESSEKSEIEEIDIISLEESFEEAQNFQEEELNYLIDEAIEICFMFNVEMDYDYYSIIEVDGVQWAKVTESKFASIKDLERSRNQ